MHDWQVNTIDGPTKLVRQDAILGGLSIKSITFKHQGLLCTCLAARLLDAVDLVYGCISVYVVASGRSENERGFSMVVLPSKFKLVIRIQIEDW